MERGAGLMGELLLGWPAMLVMAFLAGGERWRWRRRRATLNRCLHELRRPLQRIAIEQRPQGGAQIRHIHLLIDALCDLDDAVNGGSHRAPRARLVTVGSVLEDLRRRWGRLVTVENGPEDLVSAEWILADSVGIARALDNLVANGNGKSCQVIDQLDNSSLAGSNGGNGSRPAERLNGDPQSG